jgi:hypothetical protein
MTISSDQCQVSVDCDRLSSVLGNQLSQHR